MRKERYTIAIASFRVNALPYAWNTMGIMAQFSLARIIQIFYIEFRMTEATEWCWL